ncbi:MAG: ATP-binding protein [Candidatus Magasanikbacteria bacterium]|nr:ATP-binding protein [Candidatus Magasanikbacteria bacterium]
MHIKRYLEKIIANDLDKKMVFVGGPRQVGKTTLAHSIGNNALTPSDYLNWDNRADRQRILKQQFMGDSRLVIFDELHKYRQWKNYLKGLYDTNNQKYALLITGSARLDLYRHGGDSLMGRYHYFRLHPFSIAELLNLTPNIIVGKSLSFSSLNSRSAYDSLFKWGGFPEPLFTKDERHLRRWQNERLDRLIEDDIRDVELVRDLSSLQVLNELLPSKVGALFSLNSLREDLGVTHKTIAHWVEILERFYYHYRIYPYQATAIKSLRKEPKLYLWDWSVLENSAARLENIVASHLLKFVHYLKDADGHNVELFFLRDVAGREIDFLITHHREPWFAVEVKLSDTTPSKNLNYFEQRLKIPFLYQIVETPNVDWQEKNVRVMSVDKFLNALI